MTPGIVASLQELISLKRYAQRTNALSPTKNLELGYHHSRLRGRGMDFVDARNYQAGDEIRHMEWRMTARTGRPHIKLYQEERERPIVILCDFNPSMFFGTRVALKSVIAARLAAMLAWTSMIQGDKVGGLIYAANQYEKYTPKRRYQGVLPFLSALSRYTEPPAEVYNTKPRQLETVLVTLAPLLRPGSFIVLISDFYYKDKNSDSHLARFQAHHDILAYHICDPIELAPPKPNNYAITNGNECLLLDTRNKTIAKKYETYCHQRILNLKNTFTRLQIPYIQVTPNLSIPHLVRQTFPSKHYG